MKKPLLNSALTNLASYNAIAYLLLFLQLAQPFDPNPKSKSSYNDVRTTSYVPELAVTLHNRHAYSQNEVFTFFINNLSITRCIPQINSEIQHIIGFNQIHSIASRPAYLHI